MKAALIVLLAIRPNGAEFRVNTATTAVQAGPAVAASPSGSFVVVWGSPDPDSFGVFGQRYNANGARLGAEFRVNTSTTGDQITPAVAMDPTNGFVVAWSSLGGDGSGRGVFCQVFDRNGIRLGSQFRVNTTTTGEQEHAAVAVDGAGRFVVAFEGPDGGGDGVFAQRFLANGEALGPEFRVNTPTTNHQRNPSVSMDASGAFVIAWSDLASESIYDVFARRYAPDGSPRSLERRVNTTTTDSQNHPSVSCAPSGAFVVVWSSGNSDPSMDVVAQFYAASGAPASDEIHVNAHDAFSRQDAAALSDGTFFVVRSRNDAIEGGQIALSGFDSGGPPVSAELRVNTYTTDDQFQPRMAATATGLVVVWQSSTGDGDSSAIFGHKLVWTTVPGDANGDAIPSITDVLYLINFLFAGGPPPLP